MAEQGHALPAALRARWMLRSSLLVAVRTSRSCDRTGRHRDNHTSCVAWRIELDILSAVCSFRVCVCNVDFHWFCAARRTDLQTIQRLAGCGPARELLLLRTLSLPANAHDLATARPLAVPAGRHGLETAEPTGTGIGRHKLNIDSLSGRCEECTLSNFLASPSSTTVHSTEILASLTELSQKLSHSEGCRFAT